MRSSGNRFLPRIAITLTIALLGLANTNRAVGQELSIAPSDTVQTVLTAQKGKRITLRLRSGQELTGTVKEATPKLVVLAGVQGREFFDAAVPVEMIEAVLVRNRP
jgi:hypothetical protein